MRSRRPLPNLRPIDSTRDGCREGASRPNRSAGAALVFMGLIGLWDVSIVTVTMMTISVLVTVLIGLPVGSLAARNDCLELVVRPVLDAMQTLPTLIRRERPAGGSTPVPSPCRGHRHPAGAAGPLERGRAPRIKWAAAIQARALCPSRAPYRCPFPSPPGRPGMPRPRQRYPWPGCRTR